MVARRKAIPSLLFAGAAVAAGCAGGSGSPILPKGGGATPAGTKVAVRFVIPKATSSSQRGRKPAYVSSATQSIVVNILSGTNELVTGQDYANVSSSPSPCTTGTNGLTCTINVTAGITGVGTYTVDVGTFDAPQTASCFANVPPACAGNTLSFNSIQAQITPGQAASVGVTLGGAPAYLQPVQLVSGLIGGTNSNMLKAYGPGPKVLEFELLDASKNIIVAPGTPGIAGTSTATMTIAVATPAPGSGLYTLTLTPITTTSAVGPVVTPTTVPLAFTFTPYGSTTSTPETLGTIAVAHSTVYIAEGSGTLGVDAYIDGNQTPYPTGYSAGESYLGLSSDPSDQVWIADTYNDDLVSYKALDPSVAPAENDIEAAPIGGTYYSPQRVAFDYFGNAYVSFPTGLLSFTTPQSNQTPNFATVGFTYSSASTGPLVADNNSPAPNVYAVQGSTTNMYANGSTTATPVVSSMTVQSLAIDSTGDLWLLNPTATNCTAIQVTPNGTSTGVGITLNYLSPAPVSCSEIAIDAASNVYIANGVGSSGVTEYLAPGYTNTETIGSGTAPVSVTTVPNALFRLENKLGPQTNTPSPIPIPT